MNKIRNCPVLHFIRMTIMPCGSYFILFPFSNPNATANMQVQTGTKGCTTPADAAPVNISP